MGRNNITSQLTPSFFLLRNFSHHIDFSISMPCLAFVILLLIVVQDTARAATMGLVSVQIRFSFLVRTSLLYYHLSHLVFLPKILCVREPRPPRETGVESGYRIERKPPGPALSRRLLGTPPRFQTLPRSALVKGMPPTPRPSLPRLVAVSH